MSDVSSISAAVVTTSKSTTVSAKASPSSANNKTGASGKSLPLAPVLTKPKVVEMQKDALERSRESLQSAVAKMNEYVQSTQRDLRFSYDEELGSTIVKVLDRQTQEVIRQIPDDVFLKLARSLSVDEPVQLFTGQA